MRPLATSVSRALSCPPQRLSAYVSIRQHTTALLSSRNGGFSTQHRVYFLNNKNVTDYQTSRSMSQIIWISRTEAGGPFLCFCHRPSLPVRSSEFQALRPLEWSTLESSTSYHDVMPRTNASDQALMDLRSAISGFTFFSSRSTFSLDSWRLILVKWHALHWN